MTGFSTFMRLLLPLILLILLPAVTIGQGFSPWQRIKQFDTDGDGKVTKEEFQGPDRFWDRLDANGDGEVTEEEAGKMRRRGRGVNHRGGMQRGGGGSADLMRTVDTNKDGKISKSEWDAYFKKMDENGDGQLDEGEMRAAMSGRSYNDTAPKVGVAAPKVSATRQSDGTKVELARFEKPTVLVFGSWT